MDFLRHLLAEDPRIRKSVTEMLDHRWIEMLVPSDSQFQHPLPHSQSSTSTPPTVGDGAVAFSQSFENLNLSDITIPGLPSTRTHTVAEKSVDSGGQVGSFLSEVSVSAKVPGAFPQPKTKTRQPLAAVAETHAEPSWDFVGAESPRKTRGAVRRNVNDSGPSTGGGSLSPTKVPAKRKNNPLEGSSPLSSLPDSDSEEDEPVVKKPLVQRAPPAHRKAAESSAAAAKRRTRAAPSGTKARKYKEEVDDRASSADEGPQNARRSNRRHPKVPRLS